jgi:CheY-like chemotaxis protein
MNLIIKNYPTEGARLKGVKKILLSHLKYFVLLYLKYRWKKNFSKMEGELTMKPEKVIRGKYVLIVDDEKDVLDTLTELLDMCRLDTALSFEEAKKQLEQNPYDLAILDIMGVNGYELLKIASSRKIPALMLTAHALSSDNLKRSAEEGAAYYAPKDKIEDISIFMADVFESIDEGKSPWEKLIDRLGGFYDKRFQGTEWREQEKEYLDKLSYL